MVISKNEQEANTNCQSMRLKWGSIGTFNLLKLQNTTFARFNPFCESA
jgi:hypothetical protein